eukprot:Hpha_TRINITY_DN22420_c0_g1::TRINITY_DN22420_c0_g1_i1::g.94980::m.94980
MNALKRMMFGYRSGGGGTQRNPVEDYRSKVDKICMLLRDFTHIASDNSPRRSQEQERLIDASEVEHLRRLFSSTLRILVDEAKRARHECTFEEDTLPPCQEYMYDQNLVVELREAVERIPIPEMRCLFLHHITDLILFSEGPLGHYKHVVVPILELLRFLDVHVDAWAPHTDELDSCPPMVSHACIELIHALAWQLTRAVNCATFFFVEGKDLTFQERRDQAHRADSEVFLLFEAALPYLRRSEAITAGETRAMPEGVEYSTEELQTRIYTSDVAVDALICMLCIPHPRVVRYLDTKAPLLAALVAEDVAKLSLRLLKDEGSLPTAQERWHATSQRLLHRLRLLRAVGSHPSGELRQLLTDEYQQRVLRYVANKLAAQAQDSDRMRVTLRLTSMLIKEVPANLNSPLIGCLLGSAADATKLGVPAGIGPSLRNEIVGPDEDLAAAVLDLYSVLMDKVPQRTADCILLPGLRECFFPAEIKLPHQRDIDAMFYPELRVEVYSGDELISPRRQRQDKAMGADAMAAVVRIRVAVRKESPPVTREGESNPLPAVEFADLQRAGADEEVPELASSMMSQSGRRQRESNLPYLVAARIVSFLDQPMRLQLAVMNAVMKMLELGSPELTWLILSRSDDRVLTLPLALQQLFTMVRAKREEKGESEFGTLLAAARQRVGIDARAPPRSQQASDPRVNVPFPSPDEERFFCGAALLEELRREVVSVVQAQGLYNQVGKLIHREIIEGLTSPPSMRVPSAERRGVPASPVDQRIQRAAAARRQLPEGNRSNLKSPQTSNLKSPPTQPR